MVNAAKNHETALHMAAVNNCTDLCCLLLDFGANAHAENMRGCTARSMVPVASNLHDLLLLHEGNYLLIIVYI